MDKDQLLRAVDVIAECIAKGTDEVSAMRAAGFSASETRILVDALPEAFAIPVVEELGIAVDGMGSVKNAAGQWVQVSLAGSPIFVAALGLAREHRAAGTLPDHAYDVIVRRSALLGTVGKALNDGVDVKGATLSVALVAAQAEDFARYPPPVGTPQPGASA